MYTFFSNPLLLFYPVAFLYKRLLKYSEEIQVEQHSIWQVLSAHVEKSVNVFTASVFCELEVKDKNMNIRPFLTELLE